MIELVKLENIDFNHRPWSWTPFQLQQADMVDEVVNELKQYWPLTLR